MVTSKPKAVANRLAVRLIQGAAGGLLAGIIFIVWNMWFVQSTGGPAERPLRLISTIVLGDDAMQTGEASTAVGAAVHAALSVAFGIVFAFVVPWLRTNGTVALAGGLYGAVLYLVNFQVIGRLWLNQFIEGPNQPFELAVHIIFGYLLSFAFYSTGARRGEPVVDIVAAEAAGARQRDTGTTSAIPIR